MAMVMVIMGNQKKLNKFKLSTSITKVFIGFILSIGSLQVANAKIFDATLKPFFTVSQIYSDNLSFESTSAAGATSPLGGFVTELSPGFSLIRNGPHSKYNVNYRLQFLGYEGIDWSPRLFNQLQMSSNTELIDNSLYVDSSSNISQANLYAVGSISPDNIGRSSSVPYVTYRTFRLSPYWRINYGGYVNGEARFTYSNFGNSNPSFTTVNNPSNNNYSFDSNSYQESINLQNGNRLTSIGWRLSLNNQVQDNQGAAQLAVLSNSTIRFRSANFEVSNRIGMYDLTAFLQGGYYDNSYPGNLTTHNGAYLTPGLSWTPSPKLQWAVGYGYNAYFTNLTWKPSQRTTLQFSYRNSQVGGSNAAGGYGLGGLAGIGTTNGQGFEMNSGASGGALGSAVGGTSYNGMFQHRTRTTTSTITYVTATSTLQQLLTNQSTFTTPTDINGNPTGIATANNINTSLNNLNNDVFVSKNARASLSWYLSKNTFSLSAFYGNISYAIGFTAPQDSYGVTTNWNWRFSQRTSANVQFNWTSNTIVDNTGFTRANQTTNLITTSFVLTRQISPEVSANLQYNYFQARSSNVSISGSNPFNLGNFDSNRITAAINIRF